MKHDEGIKQLKRLGASAGSISLVRAFLEGRSMTICIDEHTPIPVPITRGSPQGSVLGCLLYCVTTQLLTHGLRESNDPPRIIPLSDWDGKESSTGRCHRIRMLRL